MGNDERRELDSLVGNPFARLPVEKERRKERTLEFAELVALVRALEIVEDQRRADVLRLIALTGVRPGYVCALRWSWLDLTSKAPTLTLPKTKNDLGYVVRLPSQAVDLLKSIHRTRSRSFFMLPQRRAIWISAASPHSFAMN